MDSTPVQPGYYDALLFPPNPRNLLKDVNNSVAERLVPLPHLAAAYSSSLTLEQQYDRRTMHVVRSPTLKQKGQANRELAILGFEQKAKKIFATLAVLGTVDMLDVSGPSK
jgi:hypothetical protein